ncbi:hypothetical protein ACSI5F_04055 [Ralstonia pseudosolanacearum]|uniref:hypothetical protein n=1 Tax=Ralstonia pseudosolanacearum TaxID=1310165 RepID=UPI003EE00D6B
MIPAVLVLLAILHFTGPACTPTASPDAGIVQARTADQALEHLTPGISCRF